MKRRRPAAWLALATWMLAPMVALAGPTGTPDAALLARLQQAMAAPAGFVDRYVAEVWLTDMSGRLARYLPKALPEPVGRIAFLRLVHAEATRAHLPAELVLAVIDIESAFDRFALSSAGAEGYMQIMPFWLEEAEARKTGRKNDNLFDPETNLRMGCTILRYYLDISRDDWVSALARYNGSYGRADYPYRVLQVLNTRWRPG